MKDVWITLTHIQACIDKILAYTAGVEGDWRDAPMVVDAVCRNLEIIGEAANRLDRGFRAAHPAVPWRKIIGARNILIHGYEMVERDILHDIVERDLVTLRAQIGVLLAQVESE